MLAFRSRAASAASTAPHRAAAAAAAHALPAAATASATVTALAACRTHLSAAAARTFLTSALRCGHSAHSLAGRRAPVAAASMHSRGLHCAPHRHHTAAAADESANQAAAAAGASPSAESHDAAAVHPPAAAAAAESSSAADASAGNAAASGSLAVGSADASSAAGEAGSLAIESADATADASAVDGSPRKKKTFRKIYSRLSDRKAAIQAESRARAEAAELELARARDAEAAADDALFDGEDAGTAFDDGFAAGPDGDVGEASARLDAAAAKAAIQSSPSQVRGIAAKRLALLKLHPLKMFLTSPAHGNDKLRIVPYSLSQSIDRLLMNEGFVAGQNPVLRQRNYALWHVANRAATEFAVLVRIMDEVVKRLPSLDPHTVMDYGSAAGMTLWALQESLNKYANKSHEDYTSLMRPIKFYKSVESNAALNKYANHLTGEVVLQEQIRVTNRTHLPPLPKAPAPSVENPAPVAPLPDQSSVVVAAFSLGLLPELPRRHKVLDNLWANVAPGGVLVIAEAGTIEGFAVVRQAREHLLEKHGMRAVAQRVKPGAEITAANVVAPCGSNGVCPLGDPALKRSCWFRTEILTSSLPLRTPDKHLRTKNGTTIESFSYLVLHKGPIRVNEADAALALAKWAPKQRDIYEPVQQSRKAVAQREAEEARQHMMDEEELAANMEGEATAATADAVSSPAGDAAATTEAAPTAAATEPASASAIPDDSAAASSTDAPSAASASEPEPDREAYPVTKRTDLSPLAHLLPSSSPPQTMFEFRGYSRIMRKPLKRGEHVVLDVCNEDAALERRVVGKSFGLPYFLARSVSEGDLWPLPKRVRLPTDPPSIGQIRRAELAERKARRAARLAAMDEPEAQAAKEALRAKHIAAAAAKRALKKQKIKERADEAIIARGGDVKIPVKRSERANWELMEQMAAAEAKAEAELMGTAEPEEQEQDLFDEDAFGAEPEAVAAPVAAAPKAPKAPKAAKVKAPKTTQAAPSHDSAAEPASAAADSVAEPAAAPKRAPLCPATPASAPELANASTAAAADSAQSAAKPKAAKKSASKASDASSAPASVSPKKVAGVSGAALLKNPALATSVMPEWMQGIMNKTRRVPGGLEYTGSVPAEPLEPADPAAAFIDAPEAGEYTFPADPTIRAAKLAKLKGADPDTLTPAEHLALRKAAKAAERAEQRNARGTSPLQFKREVIMPLEPLENQGDTISDVTVEEMNAKEAAAAAASSASASSADATAASAGSASASSPTLLGMRLPKWAAYRKIKSPSPVPPPRRPAPADASSVAAQLEQQLAAHESQAWDSIMREASAGPGAQAAAAMMRSKAAAATPRPAAGNFFRQSNAGGSADASSATAAAASSAPATPAFKLSQTTLIAASLPAHLQKLVNEASARPGAQHLLALGLQEAQIKEDMRRASSRRFHIKEHHRAKKAKAAGGAAPSPAAAAAAAGASARGSAHRSMTIAKAPSKPASRRF